MSYEWDHLRSSRSALSSLSDYFLPAFLSLYCSLICKIRYKVLDTRDAFGVFEPIMASNNNSSNKDCFRAEQSSGQAKQVASGMTYMTSRYPARDTELRSYAKWKTSPISSIYTIFSFQT